MASFKFYIFKPFRATLFFVHYLFPFVRFSQTELMTKYKRELMELSLSLSNHVHVQIHSKEGGEWQGVGEGGVLFQKIFVVQTILIPIFVYHQLTLLPHAMPPSFSRN